jgi:transposase-like protein
MIEWNAIAQRLGYADENSMWRDLYDVKKKSIAALAGELGVSRNTIRHTIRARGIAVRGRGGANRNVLDLTDEVIAEVKRDGVAAVAKRLGINFTTLYKRLRKHGVDIAELRRPDPVAANDDGAKEEGE